MLQNGSFSEGWTDMPPAGNLINQQPNGWTLRWIEPGASLFGAGDTATGVPECVHKLSDQLPVNERLGGPDALILAGSATYKIFSGGPAFGAELSQTVRGLKPGSTATLTAPVLAVLHGEPDPFGAESGVWVNGKGAWVNGGEMGNRRWHRHKLSFQVPDNGEVEIAIRVKSKWPRKKDFFIDGVTLEAETAVAPNPPDDDDTTHTRPGDGDRRPANAQMIVLNVPAGTAVIQATAAAGQPVVLVTPAGATVEVREMA